MEVVDLAERKEARRRAEMDCFIARQERELAEIERIVARLDKLKPLFDEMAAYAKELARRPRCEAPHCRSPITKLHPAPGRAARDAPALIRLCAGHERMVRGGRFRVSAVEEDALLWQLCDGPGAPVRAELKLPRRRPRTRRASIARRDESC